MKNLFTKVISLALVFVMAVTIMFSAVGCGTKNTAAVKLDNNGVVNNIITEDDASAELTADTQTSELSREELEQIVNTLDEDIDTDKLTDEQLSQMADDLLNSLGKGNNASVDVTENKDAYDENGAMTKPFDEVYPELIENGSVEFSDEALLIKLSNSKQGKISSAMATAGVASLEAIVPLENATWYKAGLKKGTDVKEALSQLRESGEILLAEYDYQIKTSAIDCYKDFHKDYGFDKNEYKKDQWYLHHCGIPDGYENMEHDGGQSSVIVAVIDTGVDYDHEDLAQNIWKNTDEIPDNNIDDDGNGYVDDYYGVNIVAGKGNGDDDNGHGTHVAGIIAAQNNSLGTVGIAYNTTVMPVKAAAASGYFLQSNIAKAVLYAYENGAEVINMSFGGTACSIAVQDALATAYTRCVLVASAGNDGAINEATFKCPNAIPSYPAALTYVLGVMAVDEKGIETYFTNYDYKLYNGVEYELYAPGYDIMSTLPDDRYGSLSGTSMAAPVVAGMAAILRSEFSDRDMYPTKFIYGQLTSTSENQAICYNSNIHDHFKLTEMPQIVDLNAALTKLPKPDVNMQDFAAFDTEGILGDDGANNGDGVIDAGETIALGLTLRNRWGKSENTMVTIDTKSTAGIEDPYVTIINPTVNYDAVGTYSTQDCGKIYTDELHTGWENPFYIKISKDCPNDYIVSVNVHLEYENGLDPEDETVYNNELEPISFTFTVRNGVVLPQIIDEDMTLTPDNLYIIPNSTVINKGATVTVMPGTNIQFWSDDPKDPYADTYIASLTVKGTFDVRGTKENPVMIYPSDLMSQYEVKITQSGGFVSLRYADVTNLARSDIGYADHCTFRVNYGKYMYYRYLSNGVVEDDCFKPNYNMGTFTKVENSVFYKVGYSWRDDSIVYVKGTADRCIFADCGFNYGDLNSKNCVFLGNAFVDQTKPNEIHNSSMTVATVTEPTTSNTKVAYREETGTTYIRTSYELSPAMLESLGASYAVINDEAERDYIRRNVFYGSYPHNFGIAYDHQKQQYMWSDGSAIAEFLDKDGLLSGTCGKNLCVYYYSGEVYLTTGGGIYHVYEIKGKILPTDITFNEYEVNIDTDATYQLAPKNNPVQLNVGDFIYESRNTSVVTVSDSGLVTPVGVGSTDVYVYSKDRAVYNYVTFNVVDYVALTDFEFNYKSDVIAVGETLATNISFIPDNTTRKNVTYTSSDVGVISVDAAGTLTGVSSGAATITATCDGISHSVTVRCYLKATELQLDNIAKTISLADGEVDLPVVITNDGAETDCSWRSVDESIATVENGKIIPHALGTTTIEVTDRNSGLSATCIVLVQDEAAVGIKKIDVYDSYHYVLLENGELYYWGQNYSTIPTLIESDVKDFSSGRSGIYPTVLKNDGTVLVKSINKSSVTVERTYTNFTGRDDVEAVESYGRYEFFIITSSGNVYAWGSNNSYGQLGVGALGSVDTPTLVNLDNVKQVYSTQSTTYFLTADGNLYFAGNSTAVAITPKLLISGVDKILFGSDGYASYLTTDGNLASKSIVSSDHRLATLDIAFDFVSYGTNYTNNNDTDYGIGIKDGIAYFISNRGAINQIYGITNAVYSYSDDSTHYIATADGQLFGIGTNSFSSNDFAGTTLETTVLTPVLIPLKAANEEATVTGFAQQGDNYTLTFNKAITGVTPKLYADGEQVTVNHQITNLNELVISRTDGFSEGVEYSLVFEAGAVICAGGVTNSEAITVDFTYTATDTPSDDETASDNEAAQEVVHDWALDDSIERVLTAERLVAMIEELGEQYNPNFYNNAILNRISTDTTVEHWLRLLAPSSSGAELPLGQNYWGTVNETAIGLQIIDYTDFIDYGHIIYAPYLTTAPEDTFPFVTSVTVLNEDGEAVYTVGNEQITVRVSFNRDMDTTIPLQVRFGSAYPYGDYEIEGSYVDARTWEGTYKLNTLIEGGIQYFTIENGCSATDDLELMRDRARFGFEIDTTAAQALIMQGEATDTGIRLTWTQDDFDTLMGYNVYRSTTKDGLYTRINSSVIPADTMEFFDDTVEPGVLYYYNFTVVQTDLSESIPSGKIVIMSKDTMAPDIYHSPVYNATTGSNLIISATVTDNLNITYARVYYRVKGDEEWRVAVMNNLNDKYSAIIIADHIKVEGLEYYIEAFDGISYTYKGSAENPYVVTVQESVTSDAMGDINGDGVITNLDALMLLKAINDQLNLTAEQFARADLDGDGNLAAKEALRILQYVSGAVGTVDMRS